jgi:hypothetical protein
MIRQAGVRLRKTIHVVLAISITTMGLASQFDFVATAEAHPQAAALSRQHHRPAHRPANHHRHRPVHHPHRTVIVAPVRPIPAVYPWYWGRVVAGVTVGTIIVVSVAATVPKPPSPELCWYWTDAQKTRGYWDYCVAPKL